MRYLLSILLLTLVGTAWGQMSQQDVEQQRLKAELEYMSAESVRSAYADFCRTEGYDKALYGEKLQTLEALMGKTDAVPGLIKHTGYLGKHKPQIDTPERAPVRVVPRESTVDRSQPGVSKGLPGVLLSKRRAEGMRVSQPGAKPRAGKRSWETESSCSWLSVVGERTDVHEAGPMGPPSS